MKVKSRLTCILSCIICISILTGCASIKHQTRKGLGFLTGSETILHGKKQDIRISSAPKGAFVIIDDIPRGETPLVVELLRKNNHTIRLEMPGYKPFEGSIVRRTSLWVWARNLASVSYTIAYSLKYFYYIFYNVIVIAIDKASGAIYKLELDRVDDFLQGKKMPSDCPEDTICISLHPQESQNEIEGLNE
ncbi:MAG: PEGA domain-containing protein [Thermodesulfobacteriota bacterium]|nr:PEGA domain-containing protein [Thermodesulfobacteriota bacterium]